MTDLKLTDMLERAGERTRVGPAPVDQIVAGARRTRRRRAVVLSSAVVAAVVITLGGVTWVTGAPRTQHVDRLPAASHGPAPVKPTQPAKAIDLDGTWRVRALIGKNGRSDLPDGAPGRVKMTFVGGELHATDGCNDVSGTYRQSGQRGRDLVFPADKLMTSLVGCSDGDALLFSHLLDVRHVSGSGDVRYLHAGNWMIIAELHRR